MTEQREKQIEGACTHYGYPGGASESYTGRGFIRGAEWADENPCDEVRALAEAFDEWTPFVSEAVREEVPVELWPVVEYVKKVLGK